MLVYLNIYHHHQQQKKKHQKLCTSPLWKWVKGKSLFLLCSDYWDKQAYRLWGAINIPARLVQWREGKQMGKEETNCSSNRSDAASHPIRIHGALGQRCLLSWVPTRGNGFQCWRQTSSYSELAWTALFSQKQKIFETWKTSSFPELLVTVIFWISNAVFKLLAEMWLWYQISTVLNHPYFFHKNQLSSYQYIFQMTEIKTEWQTEHKG